MAIEENLSQPNDAKWGCNVTHSEEALAMTEGSQQQFERHKIDVRTVLGLLVIISKVPWPYN